MIFYQDESAEDFHKRMKEEHSEEVEEMEDALEEIKQS